jgi:hypothetical protein
VADSIKATPAAPVKRSYTRKAEKTDPKTQGEISQNFSTRAHTANLVDPDFSGNAPAQIPATAIENTEPVLSAEVTHKPDPDDLFVWADDTWCYRSEAESMSHKSDDYRVLFADSPEWVAYPTD